MEMEYIKYANTINNAYEIYKESEYDKQCK